MPTTPADRANQASAGTAPSPDDATLLRVLGIEPDPAEGAEAPDETPDVGEPLADPVEQAPDEEADVTDEVPVAPVAPDDPLYGVPVDGVEEQVPLSKLKQSYSGQQKIAKGLQEAAAKQRQADEKEARAEAALAAYGERLQLATQMLDAQAPQEPDWDALRQADPDEYLRQRADHDARERKRTLFTSEQQRVRQEQERAQESRRQAYLADEEAKLVQALPDWQDSTKRTKEAKDLADYLATSGYKPEEFANAGHREILLARKAMLYDRLQQQTPAVTKAAATAPVVRPGAQQPAKKPLSKIDTLRRKHAQTGSDKDAEALLIAQIEAGVF